MSEPSVLRAMCVLTYTYTVCKYFNIKYNYAERGFFFFQRLLPLIWFFPLVCIHGASSACMHFDSLFIFHHVRTEQNEIYFNAFALLLLFIHLRRYHWMLGQP